MNRNRTDEEVEVLADAGQADLVRKDGQEEKFPYGKVSRPLIKNDAAEDSLPQWASDRKVLLKEPGEPAPRTSEPERHLELRQRAGVRPLGSG